MELGGGRGERSCAWSGSRNASARWTDFPRRPQAACQSLRPPVLFPASPLKRPPRAGPRGESSEEGPGLYPRSLRRLWTCAWAAAQHEDLVLHAHQEQLSATSVHRARTRAALSASAAGNRGPPKEGRRLAIQGIGHRPRPGGKAFRGKGSLQLALHGNQQRPRKGTGQGPAWRPLTSGGYRRAHWVWGVLSGWYGCIICPLLVGPKLEAGVNSGKPSITSQVVDTRGQASEGLLSGWLDPLLEGVV